MFQPVYHISSQLLRTIKRITILVYELNQRHLTQIHLAQLLSEARVTSTYASTSIEGNPLPLTEVRRLLKNHPAHMRQSEREILNYNQALIQLYEQPGAPFTVDLILQIHQQVTAGLLPPHQVGAWRQEPVVVYEPRRGDIVYLPPDYQDVPGLMKQLVDFIQAQHRDLDPLLLAGLFHKQFVVIHPFIDGNGRTARLATNILLHDLGLNFFNLLSFENYYNQNVTRYFQNVGVFGNYYDLYATHDFTIWLEYFTEGILDELLRLEKVVAQTTTTPALRLESYHQQILDYIEEHGFITDRDYGALTTRAKATRSLDFKKLMEMGLIERRGRGRTTYYQRTT
ncbi:MAG: Fic family protein [Caldilineaceae bacterium]|nr:Fic family protein [Caldilineaceae bacterium]MCB0095251.1 Fic family protein [Caldilineaceae bacterium]